METIGSIRGGGDVVDRGLWLRSIARYSFSAVAQRAFFLSNEYGILAELSRNNNLEPGIWHEMYNYFLDDPGGYDQDRLNLGQLRTNQTLRANLLSVAPNREALRYILSEASGKVVRKVLGQRPKNLDIEILNEIVTAPFFTREMASDFLTCSDELDVDVLSRLWDVLSDGVDVASYNRGSLEVYNFVRMGFDVPEKFIVDLIGNARNSKRQVAALLDIRPNFINLAPIGDDADIIYDVLTSCRHLTDYMARQAISYTSDKFSKVPDPIALVKILGNISANPWVTPEVRLEAVLLYLSRGYRRKSREFLSFGGVFHNGHICKSWDELGASLEESVSRGDLPTKALESILEGGVVSYIDLGAISHWAARGFGVDFYPAVAKVLGVTPSAPYVHGSGYVQSEVGLVAQSDLDLLGLQGWSLFISLYPNWGGDVDDLLEVISANLK